MYFTSAFTFQIRDATGANRLEVERRQPQEGRRRQPNIRRASNQRDLNVIHVTNVTNKESSTDTNSSHFITVTTDEIYTYQT